MLKYLFLPFLLLIFSSQRISAQQPIDYGSPNSHDYFVKQLDNAKDHNFEDFKAGYERYIEAHPADIRAKIERCKFIGNSYLDEYEEYNMKYEETEECIASLAQRYPKNPAVLIYRAENLYGEDKLEVLNQAKDLIETHRTDWLSNEIAEIHKMLGDYHHEENWRSLLHYRKAQKRNEALDLSLDIATIYEEQGKPDKALEVLLPNLEKDTTIWKINQKANLLLKLDEAEEALRLFEQIRKKDSTLIDNEEMANAMEGLGDFSAARTFLVNDTLQEWGKLHSKQRLFAHDLKYSDGAQALQSYRSLQQESSYDDFFGLKRIRIFLKSPLLAWQPAEVLHLFMLYLLVLAAFILPYLWVLPIYGLGDLIRKSGFKVRPKLPFGWNIRHFWLVSFFYLLASVLTVFIFEYQDTLNYYFDLGNYYEEDTDQKVLATQMVFFVLFMACSTLLVLNRKKIKDVLRSRFSIGKMLGLSLLFVLFNRIFIKFLSLFIDLEEAAVFTTLLSAKAEILAMISQYGFLAAALLVAVIVPIYEEIVFRGVILGAVEKYLGFKGANGIQAVLFGLVHDDLALFPFFFVFALITGYWVKKSGGLLTGILFHGIHNFTIVVALYYISKLSLLTT